MSAVDAARAVASDERIYRREFWTGCFDARRLARFRIAVAAVILLDVLERLRDFHTFYTDRGLLPRDRVFGAAVADNWSWLRWTGGSTGVALVFAIGIAAIVALVVGYRTRIATVIAWSFVLSVQRRCPQILDGGDLVESCLLFWLVWADAGATASLDARKHGARDAVAAFPVRMLQLQIAAIYFFTAIEKSDLGWYGGVALGRILQMQEFARPTAAWLLRLPALCRALSFAVPPTEAAIAVLMFLPWRRARLVAFACACALHLGIFVVMNVGMFSLLMPAAMTLALWPRPVAACERPRSWLWLIPGSLMALTLSSLVLQTRGTKLPSLASRLLFGCGISQSWPMFGHDAGLADFQWKAPAQLADGSRSPDILPAVAPSLTSQRRYWVYARWLKLSESMSDPTMRSVVAAYLCRRYNVAAQPKMTRFDLLLVVRDLVVAETRERKLLHQECVDR